MPATYRLFKYECANNSTNTSDTNTQTFYVLVIKNHTYEKAFVFENSEILQEDVTNCLLEKRDLGQITLALFKCERNNCKNLISRQSVAMPVHSVDLINHDATTDLHRELVYICANTGAFATLLEEIHTAHVEHLLDCLQAVIAKQCGHGC